MCLYLGQSNGDLENDERLGSVIVKMLKVASRNELGLTEGQEGFQRLTSISSSLIQLSSLVY